MHPFLYANAQEKGVFFMRKKGKNTIFHVIFIVPQKTRCYNHGRNPGLRNSLRFPQRLILSENDF